MTNLDNILKSRHYCANKGPSSQSYGFSNSHVWMWDLDYIESWTRRTDAFEPWCWRRLLSFPWTARRSNQLILKEIIPEYSLEGLMLKLELQYLWPPYVRNWLTGKHPDAGQDWRQEEKGMTEDEMFGWHHRLNGHKFEQAPGVGDGQGGLALLQSMESQRVGQDWATELKPLCPWDFPGKNNGVGCHFLL